MKPIGVSMPTGRCVAKTLRGKRCKRRSAWMNHCHRHYWRLVDRTASHIRDHEALQAAREREQEIKQAARKFERRYSRIILANRKLRRIDFATAMVRLAAIDRLWLTSRGSLCPVRDLTRIVARSF